MHADAATLLRPRQPGREDLRQLGLLSANALHLLRELQRRLLKERQLIGGAVPDRLLELFVERVEVLQLDVEAEEANSAWHATCGRVACGRCRLYVYGTALEIDRRV
jgi:hypothetical protein